MSQVIAWSHSRAGDYEKCPFMFYMKSVAPKEMRPKFIKSPQMLEGTRQHKVLEVRVSRGVPVPEADAKLEPIAASLIAAPGKTFTEVELCLNSDLQPCGWFDDEAYVRAIIDVMKLNNNLAFLGDYKTGTPDFDEKQLKLNAAVAFQTYPAVDTITTAYIWLKTGTLDPAVYKREQLRALWDELLVTPQKIQESSVMNHWKKEPGRWCKFCDVNREGKCDKAKERYRG